MGGRSMNFERPIGIPDAIESLFPGSKWTVSNNEYDTLCWLEEDLPCPSKKEIEQKIEKLKEEYKNTQYKRDRKQNYPPIEEQLDMLYHDIMNNSLENGEWLKQISSIKSNYPKK